MYKQIILIASALLLVFSAYGFVGSLVATREEYAIGPTTSSISLSSYNGTITWMPVNAYEQSVVVVEKEVRGSLNAAMEKFLDRIKVEDHSSGSSMVLRVMQPKRPFGVTSSEVRFTVYASPEQIREFQGHTSNGSIKIDADFYGLLNLKTSNGSIILRSGVGEITLRTSNGNIDLGTTRFTDSSSVRTSNGRIEGVVFFPLYGSYSFENSNGRIDLRMPHDTGGTFDVSTSNGTVDFRLGRDVITGQRTVFITRGNRPSIRVKASNGSISVRESDLGYGY